MAKINRVQKTIGIKIVYYGPGMSGKTTNLVTLYHRYPGDSVGQLVKLDTETERTLFFDYFPAQLGSLGGFKLKANFFTVPGQSFYNQTRRIVVDGCDGVVFVADSARAREDANVLALEDLEDNLNRSGRSLDDMPLIFQWNKRDLRDALPVTVLERLLNRGQRPSFEATAASGVGVWETQRAVLAAILKHLRGGGQ